MSLPSSECLEIEPEELEAAELDNTRTREIDQFVRCEEIDELYLGNQYYIVLDGDVGQQAFRVIGRRSRTRGWSGAKQVIAIDRLLERLSMAEAGGAITINFENESVVEQLNELIAGKGPEKCIDAIGMESHVMASMPDTVVDRAKQMMMLESNLPHVLREMIYVCRPAGVISIPASMEASSTRFPWAG